MSTVTVTVDSDISDSALMQLPLDAIHIAGCYKIEEYIGSGSYSRPNTIQFSCRVQC